jgi:hypothetical protein
VSLSPGLSSEDFFLPFSGTAKQKHSIKMACSMMKFFDSSQIWETPGAFNLKGGNKSITYRITVFHFLSDSFNTFRVNSVHVIAAKFSTLVINFFPDFNAASIYCYCYDCVKLSPC